MTAMVMLLHITLEKTSIESNWDIIIYIYIARSIYPSRQIPPKIVFTDRILDIIYLPTHTQTVMRPASYV